MNKLSARADSAILENDTEKKYRKEKKQSDFERVKRLLSKLEAGWLWRVEQRKGRLRRIRIKHQSLILAQDERWRRA